MNYLFRLFDYLLYCIETRPAEYSTLVINRLIYPRRMATTTVENIWRNTNSCHDIQLSYIPSLLDLDYGLLDQN